MAGKCPYCNKVITSLRFSGVDASEPFGNSWKALTYNCPSCKSVLGCQVDPIAIKTDMIPLKKKVIRIEITPIIIANRKQLLSFLEI